MNKLFLLLLFLSVIACKKDATNTTTHSIILKCWGNQQNTIAYSFGDTDVTYVGTLVTSWTIVRDVPVGKVLKLKQTPLVPQKNAATVLISDNGSQVAYAQNDTTASVTYTVQ